MAVSVGTNSFVFFIYPGVQRGVDRQQYPAVHGGLVDLVADDVGNVQELRSVLVVEREAVARREIRGPSYPSKLAVGVVDEDVVVGLVGEQEDPSLPVLHHFMTVIYRVALIVGFAPGRYPACIACRCSHRLFGGAF